MNGFIKTPQSLEDYIFNVKFQLENIEGYALILKDYESANIKVKCLIEAAEKLSEKLNSLI